MWPDPLKIIDDMIASASQPSGHKITFWAAGDFSGMDAEKFLRGYGIRVWGRDYAEVQRDGNDAFYGLTVRKKQAKWAATLMLTAGYPVRTGDLGAKAMTSLPRSSWDSVAPAVGLGGMVSEMIGGSPRAKNTRRRGKGSHRR